MQRGCAAHPRVQCHCLCSCLTAFHCAGALWRLPCQRSVLCANARPELPTCRRPRRASDCSLVDLPSGSVLVLGEDAQLQANLAAARRQLELKDEDIKQLRMSVGSHNIAVKPHVKARGRHPMYPERVRVADSLVDWRMPWLDYEPVAYTADVVKANDCTIVPGGWADPMSVTAPDPSALWSWIREEDEQSPEGLDICADPLWDRTCARIRRGIGHVRGSVVADPTVSVPLLGMLRASQVHAPYETSFFQLRSTLSVWRSPQDLARCCRWSRFVACGRNGCPSRGPSRLMSLARRSILEGALGCESEGCLASGVRTTQQTRS